MKKNVFIILIVMVGFSVNANSLSNNFVWDDAAVILNNDFTRSWKNFPLIFQRRYLTHPLEAGFNLGAYNVGSGETTYRPVTTVSYFIDYTLWKLNPFGYHLTNVILHIINAVLIYLLLDIIFNNNIFALLSTVLFVIHPVNAEVINCTAFRTNILVSLFSILSIVLYFRYKLAQNNKRRIYLIFSLFSFSLALLSKEIAVMLPLLLILCDYYQSSLVPRKIFKNFGIYSLYFLLSILYVLFYLFVMPPQQKIFTLTGIYKRIIEMFIALGIYIKGFLSPIDLFPLPAEILDTNDNFVPYVLLSLIFIILCVYVILKMKRFPKASFAILWFFITLLPVNNFIYSLRIPVAYRYLYIPVVGLCMLLSTILIKISDMASKFLYEKNVLSKIIITGIAIYFFMFTIFANASWRNDTLLTSGLLEKYPKCYSVHANACSSLLELGDLEEAQKECNIVLEQDRNKINPYILSITYLNLGKVYSMNEKYDKAEEAYFLALSLFPNTARLNVEVGCFYGGRGQHEKALEYFNKAKKINPNYALAYVKSGVSYIHLDKPDEARSEWLKALEIYPNLQEAKANLEHLDALDNCPFKEQK